MNSSIDAHRKRAAAMDAFVAKIRAGIPPAVHSVAADIVSGTKSLADQGAAAVNTVKEGVRKIKAAVAP